MDNEKTSHVRSEYEAVTGKPKFNTIDENTSNPNPASNGLSKNSDYTDTLKF